MNARSNFWCSVCGVNVDQLGPIRTPLWLSLSLLSFDTGMGQIGNPDRVHMHVFLLIGGQLSFVLEHLFSSLGLEC